LHRYLAEFDFRYNARIALGVDDATRTRKALKGVTGKRLLTQHYVMLQRNLLYTGVTRGKRLVILVGQKKAVAIAVRNISGRRRWSKLQEWLSPASQ
jgi:hypothetical protein